MKQRIAILVITLLFAAIYTTEAAGEPIDSSNVNYALSTKETALEKALQYTGFDKLEDFSKSVVSAVDLVVIEDDRTPFAADKTNGREIWKVKLDNVVVGKGSKKIGRDFEILLDPITGKLLSIFSISDKVGSSDTLPEPTAEEVEDILNKMHIRFNGFPDESPGIGFSHALWASMGNPAEAKIIRGIYIDHTTNSGRQPFTWIVVMRGLESTLPVSGRAERFVPFNERNSSLCAINAINGKRIYCMNAPYKRKEPVEIEKK